VSGGGVVITSSPSNPPIVLPVAPPPTRGPIATPTPANLFIQGCIKTEINCSQEAGYLINAGFTIKGGVDETTNKYGAFSMSVPYPYVTDVTIIGSLYFDHVAGQTVKESTADGSDMLLTDFRNLIFGIQRDIKWETERHARRRSTSFVMTLRVDTQIENPDALVLVEGLKSK
jgi:hypothetical protein